jgi:hypothetical protein
MSRRSVLLAIGIFALLALGAGTVLCLLVRYEPQPYTRAAVPPGLNRTQLAAAFLTEVTQIFSAVNDQREDEPWDAHFTDEQINSYFAETFVTSDHQKLLLRDGISEPRVVFEPDKIRLAFRYGSGFWSTVVSIDLKVWLPKDEPNAVGMQLVGFHAGALPISTQSLLERIIEVGRDSGVDVTWYRYEGYPTALIRFQYDKPRPTLELQALHLEKGALTLKGRCCEGGAVRAFLPSPSTSFKPQTE